MESTHPQSSELHIPLAGLPGIEEATSEIRLTVEREEHQAIATRARELFEARGCEGGHEREDWLRAQSELHLQE